MLQLQKDIQLTGLTLSEGYAVGRVCMFNEHRHSSLPQYRVSSPEDIQSECDRVNAAIQRAVTRIEQVREQVEQTIGKAESEIFVAQRMIVEDPHVTDAVFQRIRADGLNAEAAITEIFDNYEERLHAVDNDYLRERASDIGEAKRRLLDALGNMRPSLVCEVPHCVKGQNRIIVASDLTPGITVELDTEHTLGFVTEHGGRHSHAAILARALGIPAVSGIEHIKDFVSCGTEILVNGNSGEVIIRPTEETIHHVRSAEAHAIRMPAAVAPLKAFHVHANISIPRDMEDALEMQADGIGLYRTEIEVIAAGGMPDEQALTTRYRNALDTMAHRPVVFRLFDIGSDKPFAFLALPPEANPALGWRGTRLLLDRSDLLTHQARSLVQAAQGRILYVMYPMIIDMEQFVEIKERFVTAVKDLPAIDIRHGAMFEVPSACLDADRIFREADFGSIGTNDLMQYLFAVDRDNDQVANDFRPERNGLWEMIRRVSTAASQHGKQLSVCGELAGDPAYIHQLIECGIQHVSVSPRSIPGIRSVVRESESVQPQAQ